MTYLIPVLIIVVSVIVLVCCAYSSELSEIERREGKE